jgi:hypothetical protein
MMAGMGRRVALSVRSENLNFPGTVYGVERLPDSMIDMRLVTERAVTAARLSRWTRLD